MRTLAKERKLTLWERIVMNLQRTWRNKVFALCMLLVGLIAILATGDGTGSVFLTAIAIPMFFAREDVWRNH